MEKRYGTLNKKIRSLENRSTDMEHQDIYYELTPGGIVLCAAAGIAAELVVLSAFGIQKEIIPVPVFGFLWLLFGILVSGVLIGLEMLMGLAYGREYRPVQEDKREQAVPVFGQNRKYRSEAMAAEYMQAETRRAGAVWEYSDFRKAS